jgi:hypothetical protein
MIEDHWGRDIAPASFSLDTHTLPDEALLLEPRSTYDQALMGTVMADGRRVAVYNRQKAVEVLQQNNGWAIEEAEEWVSFNTEGAYVGPYTPVIFDPVNPEH